MLPVTAAGGLKSSRFKFLLDPFCLLAAALEDVCVGGVYPQVSTTAIAPIEASPLVERSASHVQCSPNNMPSPQLVWTHDCEHGRLIACLCRLVWIHIMREVRFLLV